MRHLLPPVQTAGDQVALRFGDRDMTYRELASAASELAASLAGARRIAVWATPSVDTVVAVVAALLAGVPVVPVNPGAGERELAHIMADSEPDLTLGRSGASAPAARTRPVEADRDAEAPAFIIYTSGTTGPPKGVILPRRAVTSNLDALAAAWNWTAADTVVHALPLYHVHGLILGVLGPLRRGGTVHHLGRFDPIVAAGALRGPSRMLFAVPTMYHRLATAAQADPAVAAAIGGARLLVSGSAPLPGGVRARLTAATGQHVLERYGTTETLIVTAARAGTSDDSVGPPLDGVEARLVDDDEVAVRGPNLFLGYLNRPDATADVMRDGWYLTGDVAAAAPGGALRIIGRRATDLIKSGGYRIGAGEIEDALLDHPMVAEVAVTGAPDPDLGERVVAWVVPVDGERPTAQELTDRVARLLAPHKRPREVHFLDRLPRNAMGKILKRELAPPPS
jgi:malonyl-CoA/methylmalonyl-CoA synthetase